MDGRKPYHKEDLDWLVKQLDHRLAELRARSFPEKREALKYFEASRAALLETGERRQAPEGAPADIGDLVE
jgi:hypothetical protein